LRLTTLNNYNYLNNDRFKINLGMTNNWGITGMLDKLLENGLIDFQGQSVLKKSEELMIHIQ